MTPTDGLLIEHISESTHLVLFIVEKSFKCHDMSSHHVAGGVFCGIKSSSLGENHPSAMLISVREHKYVAFVNQISKGRVLKE